MVHSILLTVLIYKLSNPHVASILFNSIKNLKCYIHPSSFKRVKTPRKNKQQPIKMCIFFTLYVFTHYINIISIQADTTTNELALHLVITPAS
jgi:hypothetical protein